MNRFISILLLILSSQVLLATQSIFRASVPKVAYIQWLASPEQTMNSTHAGSRVVQFRADGRAQELYLGVMCNSLSGYQIRLQATQALSPETAHAQGSGHNTLKFRANVVPIGHSLASGAQAQTKVDLSGSSPSITVSFAAASALPMQSQSPNVFRIQLIPDRAQPGQIYSVVLTTTLILN